MEIVIETDPYHRASSASPAPSYLRSPVSTQPHISTNSAFYYATLPRGNNRQLVNSVVVEAQPDGAPVTSAVRRVDKSGLLEIADVEPVNATSSLSSTTRRLGERSGLLEAVPEIPDPQLHRHHHHCLASDELLAAAATARSMVERQQHLLGAETNNYCLLEDALMRRRNFAATDSSQDSSTSAPTETCSETSASCGGGGSKRVKFADLELAASSSDGDGGTATRQTSRLSPRLLQQQRNNLTVVPDVIEAHGNSTGTSSGTSATLQPTSNAATSSTDAPEGERAEAEGCEHTSVASDLEETPRRLVAGHNKAGSTTNASTGNNGSTKVGHNDHTVHVIILSEQL